MTEIKLFVSSGIGRRFYSIKVTGIYRSPLISRVQDGNLIEKVALARERILSKTRLTIFILFKFVLFSIARDNFSECVFQVRGLRHNPKFVLESNSKHNIKGMIRYSGSMCVLKKVKN